MEYLKTNLNQTYKRFCKTLELKNDPKLIEEYISVHSKENKWPEIDQGMKDLGIIDMEIYIFGTRLFMIMDTLPDFDHEHDMAKLAKEPLQKEWEQFVSKFQVSSLNDTANEKWRLLERIYSLND